MFTRICAGASSTASAFVSCSIAPFVAQYAAELVKATYTSSISLVDHGLSMLVFVACLVEFLVVGAAATSVFFFILTAAMIDVVAGFTIGIRVAEGLRAGGG